MLPENQLNCLEIMKGQVGRSGGREVGRSVVRDAFAEKDRRDREGKGKYPPSVPPYETTHTPVVSSRLVSSRLVLSRLVALSLSLSPSLARLNARCPSALFPRDTTSVHISASPSKISFLLPSLLPSLLLLLLLPPKETRERGQPNRPARLPCLPASLSPEARISSHRSHARAVDCLFVTSRSSGSSSGSESGTCVRSAEKRSAWQRRKQASKQTSKQRRNKHHSSEPINPCYHPSTHPPPIYSISPPMHSMYVCM
ncbi:hypothetical protein IWX92DRAFT_44961 [Phyllosticta citricarpa]